MSAHGQNKSSGRPVALNQIESDLAALEEQILAIETQYLSTTGSNIITGWVDFAK